ncbi:hypothetical protein K2X30_08845 [bacterium]|nr:hypothetical protein [bacterium]
MKFGKFSSCLVVGVLFGSVAHAYIVPSQFIVKSIAGKKVGPKSLRIRSTVTLMEHGTPSTVKFKEITVLDLSTHFLKSRAYDETGQELYAIERRLNGTESAPIVVNGLLFENRTDLLTRSLKEAGIPIRTETELAEMKDEEVRRASEITSLVRWQGMASFVVGQNRPRYPQLWVERDQFYPIRLVIGTSGGTMDYRFENYRTGLKEFPYPRQISVATATSIRPFRYDSPPPVNEDVFLRAEINDIAFNPESNEFKGTVTAGFTARGDSMDSRMKDLIQKYYQLVR